MAPKNNGRPKQRTLDKSLANTEGAVTVLLDEHNGVVVRRSDKTTKNQVEIYIGNIPVDIDVLYFYHFMDKLAQGECSRIRFRFTDGFRHFAFARISAKTASETARRINGNKTSGLSKLLRRTLTCHLAV